MANLEDYLSVDKLKDNLRKGISLKVWLSVLILVSVLLVGLIIIYYPKFDLSNNNFSLKETRHKKSSVKNKGKESENKIVPQNLLSEMNKSLKIVPEKDLSNFHPGDPQKLKLILTLSDGKTQEITEKAEWASNNTKAVYVFNNQGHKGEINSREPGEATVVATYQNKGATLKIKSQRPSLKITCAVDKTKVKVGEKVTWTIIFEDMGIPNYGYKIIGDEGLNSRKPVDSFVYKTPGIKKSRVEAVDSIGSEAKADCPNITVIQ